MAIKASLFDDAEPLGVDLLFRKQGRMGERWLLFFFMRMLLFKDV